MLCAYMKITVHKQRSIIVKLELSTQAQQIVNVLNNAGSTR